MGKYRKRPVVVEAERLTWQTWSEVCDLIGEFPEGMTGVVLDEDGEVIEGGGEGRIGLLIPTLEGTMLASEGDWIIKGVQGELYPCKHDIFVATYEEVDPLGDLGPPQGRRLVDVLGEDES